VPADSAPNSAPTYFNSADGRGKKREGESEEREERKDPTPSDPWGRFDRNTVSCMQGRFPMKRRKISHKRKGEGGGKEKRAGSPMNARLMSKLILTCSAAAEKGRKLFRKKKKKGGEEASPGGVLCWLHRCAEVFHLGKKENSEEKKKKGKRKGEPLPSPLH